MALYEETRQQLIAIDKALRLLTLEQLREYRQMVEATVSFNRRENAKTK